MKKVKIFICFVIILTVMFTFVGCGEENQSGLTIDEPEINIEYLQGSYVQQLLRDGADHVFGNIKVDEDQEGQIIVTIEAKEYVVDESSPKGFYIEDRNYTVSTVLAPEARCTYLEEGVSLPQIISGEAFASAYLKGSSDKSSDYESHRMYDIYIMGEEIQLILATYIP